MTLATWISSLPDDWTAGCPIALLEAARDRYRSPGRHYHTWRHVEDCVAKLRDFACEAPQVAFLALVFHDAVYVPGDADNEARSAELAARELHAASRLRPADIAEVADIILATRHHQPPPDASDTMMAALDIDMSILGAEPEAYERYAAGVRAEYIPAVVDEAGFAKGRADFLRKLTAAPRIFHTARGYALWEQAARANLARELPAL